ncbi:hypothetical protein D3P07_00905 [Paenibacillus sp. 1011MAR3C5]|uniref:polysaccharide deacetylase family protein n=1 Tax=Paenibacillus sp. 1011MAR3C5 TaxID=1675787 RepID=UPI000E6B7A62|nr:polysaccharide deacetylase family protein [Paenibacillus sp. 1011MAR3C5]RJE90697.1 hypothetical protein D3P07_00905 [Paenibacillus sp. 1011MAR3C5]
MKKYPTFFKENGCSLVSNAFEKQVINFSISVNAGERHRQRLRILELPGGVEIVDARKPENGDAYPVLGARLNAVDGQLSAKAYRQDLEMSFAGLYSKGKRRTPLISFICDNAPTTDVTRIKPIAEEKNVPFGIGVITALVGTSGYMTYAQIKEMEPVGCEIMAHSHQHRDSSTLTPEELDEDVKINLSLLRQNGFNPSGFIYPYNEYRNWTNRNCS